MHAALSFTGLKFSVIEQVTLLSDLLLFFLNYGAQFIVDIANVK